MLFSDWRSKSRARTGKSRLRPIPRKGFRRAWAEYLENRILMAVRIWDGAPDAGGASANANWTTPSNWLGDVAPLPDDNLVFPAGALLTTNLNDFTSGTRFRSISISGNYNLNGQQLVLLEGITANHTSGLASLLAPVSLLANQTFISANPGATLNLGPIDTATLQNITVDGSGTINMTGAVSGSGGILKVGDGTLILSGATDNTYSGNTTVSQGALIAQKDTALGSVVAGTLVTNGGSLNLQGNITVPESIVFNGGGIGTGFDGLGALRGIGGNSIITGDVAIGTNNSFVGVETGAALNLNGAVRVLPGTTNNGFTKYGGGTLELSGNRENQISGTVTVIQGTLLLNKTGPGFAVDGPLVIGDNLQGNNASVVRLGQNNQINPTDFFGTNVNTVTINSSGWLNLNGFNTTIGPVTMVNGASYSADITTGTGTLSLAGNVTVTSFQGSSQVSPPSFISGKLDLGPHLSINSGSNTIRGFNVGQAVVPGANMDLLVTADISGSADVALFKGGAGIMRLSGNNTYDGATIVQAGYVGLSSDTALGDGVLSFLGGSLIALDGPRTVTNPVSLDATVNILGSNSLTFTAPAVLTGDRTINVFDPSQVVTFAAGIGEGVYGARSLAKGGKGVLEFTAPSTYSGTTTINTDGGTIRLKDAGTLQNNQTVTIGIGGVLAIDNTATNNTNRLHDLAAVNINGGVLSFTGQAGSASGERFGVLSWGDQLSSKIESSVSTAAGSSVHLVAASMPTVGTNRMINFVGNGVGFSATGPNRFTIAQPAAPALVNGILPLVSMLGPSGYDLVTLESAVEGMAVVPLPASAYVTDITKAEPTSNVKLAGNQTHLIDDTRTINALVLGPGAVLQGGSATLTVGNGTVIADDQSVLNVNILALPGSATITTPRGGTSTINSMIVGASSMLSIGGGGKVIFTAANQMSGQTMVQEGILNIQNSLALGSVAGTTTVRQGGVIELEQSSFGPVNVPTETITINGTGIQNGGVLRNVIGVNTWAGNVVLAGDATDQFSLLGLPSLAATAIVNIADGTRFTINGVLSGNFELVKAGDGTLEYGGVFANSNNAATRIVDGTLLLNKAPGVNAVVNTVFVGDDLGGAGDDVLALAGPDQIPDATAVTINSSGAFNLNGFSEATGVATLFIGPSSSASVSIGIGTWTTSNITVQSLGNNNPTGAEIFGGTLALSVLGTVGGFTRTWLVNDGAVGSDLHVNSTITDGSFLALGNITKSGFGALQYDGAQANTYTGTTTVNEGALILNKPANTQAFAGGLTIGDGSLVSGGVNSDIVKLLSPNQIPDFQTAVTINSTGLLDLTDMDETLGTPQGAAITTRLTLNGGNVITGSGVLTINGGILTGTANQPATISGHLNMGSSAMTINVGDSPIVFYDLIISADMVGTNANELFKTGAGNLLLTGTNSYSGRTYHTAGTLSLGSNSAIGSGPLFLQSSAIVSYGAGRTLSNTVTLSGGVTLVGANPLTFTGLVNMTAATTFNVANSTFLTFSGGVGELFAAQNLTKSGSGFLRISSLASYSGTTTIGTAGGAILLSGNGALPNTTSVTIGAGGTLALDNRTSNLNNRLRDSSAITINAGMLDFVGHAAGSNELVGTITTSAGQISAIRSTSRGALAKLTANSLVRGANSMVDFQGFGSDLGSATNQLFFFTTPVLTLGLLPFTTLTKSGDLDFVTYGLTGVAAAPFVTDIDNAKSTDNVKLSSSANITSTKNINALLLSGSGVVLSGTSLLTVVSGTIFGAGGQNAITVPTIDLGINPANIDVDFGSQLAISSSIVGSGGITKIDEGKLIFSGASTYSGTTTVAQGILNIQNSLALGAAGFSTATNGTTVLIGAALEIEDTSGPILVPEELLTINGVGYGSPIATTTSGNRGALRNIGGNNTWAGNVVGAGTTAIGADSGSIAVNGVVSGTTVTLNKFGPGTLQLGGTASNTWTGSLIVAEGTVELNKTSGLIAVPTTLTVGDNVDGAATVRFLSSGQLSPAPAVTVGAEGVLDLNGFDSRVGNLSLFSGYSSAAIVSTGSGTLTIGNMSSAAVANSFGSTVPATVSGNLQLSPASGGSGNRTITVAETLADDDLIISANIIDGDDNSNRQGIIKVGAGRVVLSGANTYTGQTSVNAGSLSARSNLALGDIGPGAGTVVAAAAALEVQDDINVIGELLTLNSTGVGATGALRSMGGNNSWSGDVTVATTSTIGVNAGSHLNLSGVVTMASAGLTMIKLLPGTLELSGSSSNVFNGGVSTLAVREGTLLLNKSGGADAIPVNGTLLVGNDFGGSNADVVRFLQGNQINNAATVQVTTSGLIDLNGQNETVGPLTMNFGTSYAGRVITGAGTLTLGGTVTVTQLGSTNPTFEAPPARIEGNLDLGDAPVSINVGVNASMPREFEVLATVSNPNGGNFTKIGTGALALLGDNTGLTGIHTLNNGNLVVGHNNALGNSTLNVSGTQGTLRALAGGGPITLNNPITLNGNLAITGDQNLTLNGQVMQVGAARTLSFVMNPQATSDLAGGINLGTAAALVVNSISFGGTVSISGPIVDGTGAGGITKGGIGRLIVSDSNSYTGVTTVNGGVLEIRSNNALGSTVGGTTVNVGAALEVNGSLTIGENLTLGANAVGFIVPTGALRSVAGTSVWSGNIALGTAANNNDAIGVDTGSQLTVTGPITQTVASVGLIKVGGGVLELAGGATPNTYAGTTTVREGTLRLNKAPGTQAFGGPLVIGDDFGGMNADVVELVTAEQIPNAQAVTLQSTGRLVGTSIISNETQTVALSGNTTGGNFTLSLDGTPTGNIAFNATAADVDAALEALPNIGPGNVTVFRTGAGPGFVYTIIFTGGLAGTNQSQLVTGDLLSPAAATVTSATVQDSGNISQETIGALTMTRGLTSSSTIDTGIGALAISGNYILNNVNLTMNSSPAATIDGRLNITTVGSASITRQFTVNDSVLPGPAPDLIVNAQIGDGDGNIAIQNLSKVGAGSMMMTGANTYSGTTTVSAAFNGLDAITGALILQGNGTISAELTNSISVTAGARLILDNTAVSANRVHDLAAITLAGGSLIILGNGATGTTENFNTLTINQGAGFESVVHSITRGGTLTQLVGTSLLRGNGGVLRLVGERSDGPGGHLGDVDNQLIFTTSAPLTNDVLTFATVQGPGTYDLVRDTDGGGNVSLGRILTYDTINTPGGNVKLTASAALTADNSINSLLIDGNNISLSGGFNLGIGNGSLSGLIASRGGNNSIGVSLIDFDTREVLISVESGELDIASTMNSLSQHVRKDRPGNLKLSGNNNGGIGFQLEGNITVNQGTLTVRNGDALGTGANGTFFNAFATLVLDASLAGGSMLVNEEPLTLSANFGINNGLTGAVKAINGITAYGFGTAPINAGNGAIIYDVNLGSELILNATIGGGANGLTKIGDGVLELGGFSSNTFTGTTTVNQGELRVNKSNGLAILGAIVVGDRSGGNDRLTYSTAGSTDMLVGNSITINQGATFNNGAVSDVIGNFVMNGGSIISSGGILNLTGSITYNIGGPAIIGATFDLGNATRTINVADGGDLNDVTFNGQLLGGAFSKTGAGTMLMASPSSTGNWVLNGGNMSLASNNGLGSGALIFQSSSTLRADLTDVTLVNPLVFLNSIAAGSTLTLGGRRDTGFTSAIRLAGPVTMPSPSAAAALNINVDEPLVNAEISGVIGGGNANLVLAKTGIGKLRLSGDNTFNVRPTLAATPPATGNQTGISINGGTLSLAHSNALGASATNVNVRGDLFAALEIDGSQLPVHLPSDKTIVLLGTTNVLATGVLNNYTGMLRNSGGNNSIAGVVDVRGAGNAAGQVINVFVNVENNSSLAINNSIIGSFALAPNAPIENANRGIIKIGDGELIYGGNSANTIAGTTQIWSGTLTLNKTPGIDAVRGTLIVGDNVGASASDVVRLANDDQLAINTTLTVNGSGEYDMNNFDDTVGNVNLVVSQVGTPTISMSGSNLELNGNVSLSAYNGIDGPTSTIVLDGNITLTSTGNGTRIFTIANTPTDVDLIVSSRIVDGSGGVGGLGKAGPGRMRLTGNNSFTGGVAVTGGCLTVTNSRAMGDLNVGNVSVSAGAVLELGAGLNIGNKTLTLNGTGFLDSGSTANLITAVGSGALVTLGGSSSWLGNVVLAAAATGINVTSGQFRIDGAVSQSGTSGLVKLGSGTLEFSGNTSNTYLGSTVINEGSILLNKSGGNITAISTGAITIGDNFGGDNADQLNYGTGNSTNQIGGASIVILPSGQFNMNDASDTIGALTASFGPTTGDVNIGLGNLSLGGNLVAIVAAGVSGAAPGLNLTGTLDLGAAARTFTINDTPIPVELNISASIMGAAAANLTLIGVGPTAIEMGGSSANTYLGTTIFNEGNLILNKSVGPAVPGNFTIGDNLGGPVDLVRYGSAADSNQIGDNAVVTVNSSGILDLATNSKSDIIGNATTGLNLVLGDSFSSQVRTGSGVLTILGNISVAAPASSTVNSPSVVISGNLSLQSAGGGPATRTITVNDSQAPIDVVISANIGDGDLSPQSLSKVGAGTLVLSGNNTFSGNLSSSTGTLVLEGSNAAAGFTTITAGELIFRNNGSNAAAQGYSLGNGVRFSIDNTLVNVSNRVADLAPFTLAGNNTISFIGRPGQTSTETIGSLVVPPTSNLTIESNVSLTPNSRSILTAFDLVPLTGSKVRFVGGGAALGTTENQVRFVVPPSLTPASVGILPYAQLINPSGVDLVTYGVNGITAPIYASSLATAGPNDVVKLTASEVLNISQTVNALLLVGDGINLSGVGQLRVTSGSITVVGAHSLGNSISIAELALGSAAEPIITVDPSSTLTISGAISSNPTSNLRKQGTGMVVFAGDNSVTGSGLNGNITVDQGILRITNRRALGNQFPLTATLVNNTGALQIVGDLDIGNEVLALNGSGFNNDGSGALQLLSGNATWGTGTTPINLVSSSTVRVTDGSRLVLNATVNNAVTLTKVGEGTLTLAGSAANGQSTTVNEGTVELAKTAAVQAVRSLIVGDNLGGDNADRVIVITPFNNQTGTDGNVATMNIQSTGYVDTNNTNIVLASLTLVIGDNSSADITSGTGRMNVSAGSAGGNVTVSQATGSTMVSSASVPATISGNLAFPNDNPPLRRFTLSNSPADVDLLVTANISGPTGLVVSGAGRMVLDPTNANTFAGNFTVASGAIVTLRNSSGNNSALSNVGGFFVAVNSGGSLELDNFTLNNNAPLFLAGSGVGGQGALRSVGGSSSWGGGAVALNIPLGNATTYQSATIGASAGSTLTIPGLIDADGNVTLTTTGAGVVDLIANNTMLLAPTVVNEGTLRFSGVDGASASPSYTVNSGAALVLNNLAADNFDRLIGSPSVTLNGGAITLIGNLLSPSFESIGNVTLASGASKIRSAAGVAGQRFVIDNLIRNAGTTVQFEGIGADLGTNGHTIEFVTAPDHSHGIIPYATIVGPAGYDFARQTGVSIERLPAANYHTDLTTATPTDNVKLTASEAGFGNITVNSLLILGNGIVAGQSGDSLNVGNGTIGAIAVVGGNNTLHGGMPLQFGVGEGVVRMAPNATVVLAGPIHGASGLTISGEGFVQLQGNNTYSGDTNIVAGGVLLQNSNGLGATGTGNGTVVANQASLALSNVSVGDEALTLNDGGISNFGALINAAGDNTWGTGTTAMSLPTNSTINVFGGSLALNGTIGGAGALTKTGLGTLILGGSAANTFSGGVNVNEGALQLRKTAAVNAIASGTVTIGDGIGSDLLQFTGTDNQIPTGVNVVMASSGVLDLNNRSTSINTLSMTGSTINTGTGVLSIGSTVTIQPAANPAVINGFIGLTGARNFAVYDNAFDNDLIINASIIGAGGAPSKVGRGGMAFNNVNSYTGGTTVSLGLLEVRNAFGLGSPAGGTTVSNGGILRITGAPGTQFNVPAEAVSFPGTGLDGVGVWEVSGAVTWAGTVSMTTTPTINVAAGSSLALQDVTGFGFGFNKRGDGLLALNGTSSNTGETNIFGGTLLVGGTTNVQNTITLRNGSTLIGTGTVGGTVLVSGGATVSPGVNGVGTLTTGTIRFTAGSTLFVDIAGMTPGVTHDVLRVVGGVFLNDALLAGNVPIIPTIGDQFRVIENDFADAVNGDFAAVDLVTIDFRNFSIDTAGGDGNDVVFTSVFTPSNQAPVINAPSSLLVVLDNVLVISPFSITDSDAGASTTIQITLTVTHGTLTFNAPGFIGSVVGSGSNTLIITSSLAAMNAVFASSGLVYQRTPGFLGSDTIVVVADDQGASGIGGPQQSTRNILISVVGVSAWQNNNPGRSQLDVNNDGFINSFDVITMVSELNSRGAVPLPGVATPPPYMDVNGDGNLSAIDLLLVVAWINDPNNFAPLSTVVISPDAIAADAETVNMLAAQIEAESPTIEYVTFDDTDDPSVDAAADDHADDHHVAFALASANSSQPRSSTSLVPVDAVRTAAPSSVAATAIDAWDYADTLAGDIIDSLFTVDDDELPAVLLTELE